MQKNKIKKEPNLKEMKREEQIPLQKVTLAAFVVFMDEKRESDAQIPELKYTPCMTSYLSILTLV